MEEEVSSTTGTAASNNGPSGSLQLGMSPHMTLDQLLTMPASSLPIPSMFSGGTAGSTGSS